MAVPRLTGLVILFTYSAFGSASSVTLSASPNPSKYGQAVTLTATVTPGASGKVTFYDGVTMLGVASLFGTQASLTTVFLPSGARSLRAYYSGDGTYSLSSSEVLPHTVIPAISAGLRQAVNYPSAAQGSSIALGDFNGDGKPDFATVDGETKIVSVFLGNGDGTFRTGQTYSTVSEARALAAGDFNGDGRTDLIIASQNQFSGSLSVLLGNGDGTFQPPLNYPLASNPYAVAIADFNNDGIADVVTANSFGSTVSILLGRGDGSFQPEVDVNVTFSPGSLAIADFNRDGYADIAVSGLNGVSILLGQGGTNFAQTTINNLGSGSTGNILAVGDLNNDGNPDLLRVGMGVTVLLGNGDGSFGTPIRSAGNLLAKSIAVADFNGDGILDVAAVDAATVSVAVMRGIGDGTFQAAVNQPVVANSYALAAGDFNSDGTVDVVVTGYSGAGISVLLGGAASELSIAATHRGVLTPGQSGFTYLIVVSDGPSSTPVGSVNVVAAFPAGLTPVSIGGIGWTCNLAALSCTRADSLAINSSYPAIVAKVNAEGGLTGTVKSSFVLSGGGSQNAVTAIDSTYVHVPSNAALVSSPNPSVLGHAVTLTATVTSGATGSVSFYNGAAPLGSAVIAGGQAVLSTALLPSGSDTLYAEYGGDSNYGTSISAPLVQMVTAMPVNGLASPTTDYLVSGGIQWIGAADVNGDGKPDLVTVNFGGAGGSINVLLGAGNGKFAAAVSYPVTSGSVDSAAIGDFNGDGKIDVIVASSAGLFLLLGNGDGTFQAARLVSPSTAYTNLLCGDLDRDGKLDLVAISGGNIVPFLGNGDGTFQQFQSPGAVPNPNGYSPLAIADMNGDGTPDLIALDTRYSGSAAVLLGNGDGTFASALAGPPTNVNPTAMAIGDFNGDGKPDVAIPLAGGIIVLLGDGNGGFQAPIKSVQPYTPGQFAVAGDFDGDGKLDLAFTAFDASAVYVAFGNGDGTFRPGVFSATSGYLGAIAVADFNGDGKLDLAVSTGPNASINVYLGVQLSGLSISSSHLGSFTAGKSGTYNLTVGNPEFPTSQVVTVTDTLPAGLTASSIGGTGWSCTLSSLTCTRTDVLNTGGSYPAVTVAVNVAGNLQASVVTNQAAVTYAGAAATATDPTTIIVPSVNTLAVSPIQSTLHQPIAITATVPAGATGTVMFSDNGTAIGAAAVAASQAVFSTRLLLSGSHSLVAAYAGDSAYAPSTSAVEMIWVGASPSNSFNPAVNYPTGAGPSAIGTGDFNLDGFVDLVTANAAAGTVSVLLGKGDGTFSSPVNYPAGFSPAFVVVGDFNNDGKPDIGVASSGTTTVSLLIGNGNGTFQSPLTYYFGGTTTSLGIADFFGTGQPGLAATNDNNNLLGLAFFRGTSAINLLSGRASVIADLNNDGVPDVAVWPDSGVYSFLGNGDGTFRPAAAVSDLVNASAIGVGDLNGDGKPDLVASNDQGVVAFLGNGDGTFQVQGPYAGGSQSPSIFCTDVNGDGNADVVVVNSAGGSLSVLLGNGDGTLQSPISYPVGANPIAIVAGDFNGDGITDLAVANSQGNNVSILLGVLAAQLNVTSSHFGSFGIGQLGAAYTITVTNVSSPASGAVTVTDTLPAGLAATAIAGTGWNCTLATLTCTRADTLATGASYPAITVTVNVTANSPASVNNQVSVSGGGSRSANSVDLTVIAAGTPITIQTSPAGLQFHVDDAPAQTAPLTLNLVAGTHTIAVDQLLAGSPGTQYVFMGWSDAGNISHNITVGTAPATYTASFKTQYQLITAAFPLPGGSVTPPSGTYVDAGSTVTLTASPNSPYVFTSWTGGATTNPLQVAMSAPESITAAFSVPGFTCAITGDATASVADVQLMINEALGLALPSDDLNRDNTVDVADVQKVIEAALGAGCIY